MNRPRVHRASPASRHDRHVGVARLLRGRALSSYVLLELAAIVTVGVSLLMGCAGQVSLGQGAFYACGAYAAALLATHGCPTVLGLLAAPVVAALLAVVIGIPLLTLRGHHLAFATLAMQIICLSFVGRMPVAGGDIGLQGIPRFAVASFELGGDRDYAYLAWGALALVVVTTHNVIASRPGRALRALASSEVAAESSGVPVGRYKLIVFALAGAFAGLAGASTHFSSATSLRAPSRCCFRSNTSSWPSSADSARSQAHSSAPRR